MRPLLIWQAASRRDIPSRCRGFLVFAICGLMCFRYAEAFRHNSDGDRNIFLGPFNSQGEKKSPYEPWCPISSQFENDFSLNMVPGWNASWEFEQEGEGRGMLQKMLLQGMSRIFGYPRKRPPMALGMLAAGHNAFTGHSEDYEDPNSPPASKHGTALYMIGEGHGHTLDSEDFTDKAWEAVSSLGEIANRYKSSFVEADMLLLSLLNLGEESTFHKILSHAGVDVAKMREDVEVHLSKQPRMSGGFGDQKVLGRTLQNVLSVTRRFKSEYNVGFDFDGVMLCRTTSSVLSTYFWPLLVRTPSLRNHG